MGGSGRLTNEERESLEKAAAYRVGHAFTAFTTAVARHMTSMKAEAKAHAEMIAAALDVFFGLAAPVFANAVANQGGAVKRLADKVVGMLSKQSGEKTIQLISQVDLLKESFKAVGKVGSTAVKLNANALFGEDDVDAFAVALRKQFHAGVDAITDKLAFHKFTDEEVISTFLAYDSEFASEDVYVEALKPLFKAFSTYVLPIGRTTFSAEGNLQSGNDVRGAYVNVPGRGPVLFLIEDDWTAGPFPTESRHVTEVPPQMVSFVIAKTVREYGTVETIRIASDPPPKPDPDSVTEAVRRATERAADYRRRAEAAAKAADARRREAAAQWLKQQSIHIP